jgi:hypothetical protein
LFDFDYAIQQLEIALKTTDFENSGKDKMNDYTVSTINVIGMLVRFEVNVIRRLVRFEFILNARQKMTNFVVQKPEDD